jgi:hypothetical protein
MMKHMSKQSNQFSANISTKKGGTFRTKNRGFWSIICRNKDGEIKWIDDFENLVVDEGLDHLLDVTFDGGAQVDPWYIGLLTSNPNPQANWDAADIAANDFLDYDEVVLQTFVVNPVSGQSIDNVGNVAVFTISQDASTVGGCFLISTDAKAVPAGILYCAGAFSGGDKSVDDNDTLQVTVTLTTADDGV